MQITTNYYCQLSHATTLCVDIVYFYLQLSIHCNFHCMEIL